MEGLPLALSCGQGVVVVTEDCWWCWALFQSTVTCLPQWSTCKWVLFFIWSKVGSLSCCKRLPIIMPKALCLLIIFLQIKNLSDCNIYNQLIFLNIIFVTTCKTTKNINVSINTKIKTIKKKRESKHNESMTHLSSSS